MRMFFPLFTWSGFSRYIPDTNISNRFFTSPDDSEVWNVFHATPAREGACDGNRYTMALQVQWNEDGTPNFGEAPDLSVELEGPSGE